MKFLILGASSFYGEAFRCCALAHGDTVTVRSRPDWGLGDPIPPADCVVNFASRSLVAESWIDPQGWLMTNAVFTTALLDQVRAMKCRFVHVSTPEVYGHTPRPVKEGAPFNPSTPYAVSRAAGDMMLAAYQRAYGMDAIITRTANIYGFGQPDYRFIPHAFKTLRAGAKLTLDGGGATIRGFLHVKNAAEATYLVCKEGRAGETYHIAPQGVLTIAALAKMICAQIGADPALVVDGPERRGKDLAYIMDSSKLRALGWSNRITLKEGLAEYGNHLVVS